MSTVHEIVYHKELNMFSSFCGYMGLYHHCTRKMRGFIKFVSSPTDCRLCEKEADRKEYKEYNSFAGKLIGTVIVHVILAISSWGQNPYVLIVFVEKCYLCLSEKCACFKD